MLRVDVSRGSAGGFPHRDELYLLYPKDIPHFGELARSRSFMPLAGLDVPTLAFKASRGRLSMFNFSGLASRLPGAVATGLKRVEFQEDVNFGLLKNQEARRQQFRVDVLARCTNLPNSVVEKFPEVAKVRIIHCEGRTVWFQLTMTLNEKRIFEKNVSANDLTPRKGIFPKIVSGVSRKRIAQEL